MSLQNVINILCTDADNKFRKIFNPTNIQQLHICEAFHFSQFHTLMFDTEWFQAFFPKIKFISSFTLPRIKQFPLMKFWYIFYELWKYWHYYMNLCRSVWTNKIYFCDCRSQPSKSHNTQLLWANYWIDCKDGKNIKNLYYPTISPGQCSISEAEFFMLHSSLNMLFCLEFDVHFELIYEYFDTGMYDLQFVLTFNDITSIS